METKKQRLTEDSQGIRVSKDTYYKLKIGAANKKIKLFEYLEYLVDLDILENKVFLNTK